MSVLLVTFDIKKPEHNSVPISSVIHNYFHIKLSPSTYAIYTNQPSSYVYKKLKTSLEPNDYLYIIPLSKPWSGYGPLGNRDWLENYL